MLPESGSRPFFCYSFLSEPFQKASSVPLRTKDTLKATSDLNKFYSILWVSLIASKMSSFTTGQRLATRTQQQQNRSCEYPNITASIQYPGAQNCANVQGIASQSGRRAQLAIKSQWVIPGAQHQGVSSVQRSQPASRTAAPKCSQHNTCKLENGTSRK